MVDKSKPAVRPVSKGKTRDPADGEARDPANGEARESVFWGQEGDEVLSHVTLDDAVEHLIGLLSNDPLPRTLTMFGFAPKEFDTPIEAIKERISSDLVEWLDESYGNPDDWTDIPKPVEDAIHALAEKIVKHWPVWLCDPVESVDVDTVEWIKKHAPVWMDTADLTFEPIYDENDNSMARCPRSGMAFYHWVARKCPTSKRPLMSHRDKQRVMHRTCTGCNAVLGSCTDHLDDD